ncbi:DEAD/DEAH box helicase [Lysinibacillus sp. LZ02]|uniref:DEAD/DEAH box helicase n=1 Tax=Lysinibacillus sp. LZ02 TaxID=3420668 RepID=UPI003D36EC73
MIETVPFVKTLRLKIELVNAGYYSLTALNEDGLIHAASSWAPLLYYKYEPNFYGISAKMDERDLMISAAHLLDALSPRYKHPFLHIEPADPSSAQHLAHINDALTYWQDDALWQHAHVIEDKLTFDVEHAAILEQAVTQQLTKAGLTVADVPALLPYFQNGGWPLQTERMAGNVQVALRLSEPVEQEEDWVLETVLLSPTSAKHWTPAIRKRTLPIEMVLPEKWAELTPDIEQLQDQIIKLLTLEHHAPSPTSFIHIRLQDADVRHFLQYDLAKLQALGFEIILPAWLKELKQSKLKVRVSAGNTSARKTAGLDDILTFRWQFSMNNEAISAEQFRKLVEEKREFMRIGNEWFRIDANWLHEMRELMNQAEEENWTVRELLFRELPETLMTPLEEEDDAERDDPMFAFEMQKSLQGYIEQLQHKQGLPSVAPPIHLQATLRPYQQQGYEWLVFMRQQQFGACLADDMGLGKTVQLISYVLYTIETLEVTEPTIIICPTSVLGNWQKELARFAPTLTVHTHYGANRLKNEQFERFLQTEHPHIILSTYGTISQDAEFLQHIRWATVVLDEAQNIKNMQTLQSRSIRTLKGAHHIALTGTPVENRLSELWAIFDFMHKGYLGSFGKFQEQFILPIEKDESEKHKQILQMKIRPFLLRRTKRDPDLMLNLPDKQETQEFCPLTPEQAALYEGFIEETVAQLEKLTGFEKKGRILKMLNKLKQLCNHPALYLKEPFDEAQVELERSVKVKRIVQLAADIVENGEQCLIFTQYIGMGQLLQHCFSELYDLDVPFLTGSMPKQQRDRLVESFQKGEFPIFLLSLKAGGTGLNLTAANHVLHADRWWNPAVENQATDRAYRIGQTQFVQVHKFITIGTIEEKIDKMLAIKSALSEELIQSSKWLTELDDAELMNLMMLDTANLT